MIPKQRLLTNKIENTRGQTDLERKSSADEREVYEGTPSEETAIKQKNSIKWRKPQVFNLNFLHKDKKYGRSSDFSLLLPFFVWLRLNATAPTVCGRILKVRVFCGIISM